MPQLLICNKIDNLDDVAPRIDRDENGIPIRVWLSARANIGVELLFKAIAERLDTKIVQYALKIPPSAGKFRGELYQLNCIDTEEYDDEGNCCLQVKLPVREWNKLVKHDKANIEGFIENSH